ncbi:ribosome assembly RNA-binding protein YhbY [Alcanivorax sp. 1008]|uniref:ribosome assembly RNA-binding protein YhbY n=1 Tax=Alcanivorax sp. 1008 TaxID=2816853 RepID=UPI001D883CBF|nr:ribosome assembly RNA-binding protein YhbY [Alcanivorax sp. 1008]MCC1497066.1 ribosome assembly RNA-binding protein YhbY [Alcanivorax sp. 1008]
MPLSPQDRKRLKAIGHHLNAILILGDKGLSESFIEELNLRLEDHELIKVRVNAESREDRHGIVTALCEAGECELVQLIGKIAILYRPAKKPNPKLSNLLRFSAR